MKFRSNTTATAALTIALLIASTEARIGEGRTIIRELIAKESPANNHAAKDDSESKTPLPDENENAVPLPTFNEVMHHDAPAHAQASASVLSTFCDRHHGGTGCDQHTRTKGARAQGVADPSSSYLQQRVKQARTVHQQLQRQRPLRSASSGGSDGE
mmetsp:Transcript_18849/g.52647  ORF Transcript_18849/g.52647 Transcript_18849/m.52647 type:complete len:157 (+) Transcript_18849:292-762(+)